MTIDKALREYQTWLDSDYHPDMRPHINALLLGIEALKRVQITREQHLFQCWILLPGETNK